MKDWSDEFEIKSPEDLEGGEVFGARNLRKGFFRNLYTSSMKM
jgi:hypothetical protein